ncbi:hypothetical protein V6N13_073305 [Hibiscus sabdariffa]
MTRRKVELAWITNQSARRASLKKRRASLLKKVLELTTLCGIKACLVMYSPGEQEPMTWPSPDEAKQLIKKFYFVPELERLKRTMTMEMYMTEKLSKVQNDLMKLNMKNKEAEVGRYMLQIHHGKMMDDFNFHELEALIWFAETRRTILRKRVEFYKQVSYPLVGPSDLQPLPQGPAAAQGQPRHPFGGDFSSSATDLGLSRPSFGSSSRAVPNQGLPLFPTFDNSMFDVGFPKGDYLGPFGGHDGESSSNATACSDGSEMEPSEDRN